MPKIRPIDYLTNEERFIFRKVKRDIKLVKTRSEILTLEKTLDELLKRVRRRVQNAVYSEQE